MGGQSLGNGLTAPVTPSYGMDGALGNGLQMGMASPASIGGFGNGITVAPGGGIATTPTNEFNGKKMADALSQFKFKPLQQQPVAPVHNAQEDYQRYLNMFNAQNRG